MAEPATTPLFPLRTVLFPQGRLPLKIFEARYLDMVSHCLRSGQAFGVLCLKQGAEAGRTKASSVALETVGVMARIEDVDSTQAGILMLQCVGEQRFELLGEPQQQADGLWLGATRVLPADDALLPTPDALPTVTALARAIQQLRNQGQQPFAEPYRLDDAGWVANRWCELLPISLAAKQMLMALPDAGARLALVDRYLREQGIVKTEV